EDHPGHEERAAAVARGHAREAPDVARADRHAEHGQQHPPAGAEDFGLRGQGISPGAAERSWARPPRASTDVPAALRPYACGSFRPRPGPTCSTGTGQPRAGWSWRTAGTASRPEPLAAIPPLASAD